MTTYYRDSSVLVSSSAISVDGASYRLADLGEVWLAKGPWQPQRALAVLVMRILVAAAVVGLFVAIAAVVVSPHRPLGGRLPPLAVWGFLLGSPVLLGVLIVAAERTRERGLRYLLLCAEHGGEAVVLYTTTEPRRFGQVHRAVQRALERHDG
jgi:hypothetical protein